jgi:rhamnosyltransferase
MDNISVIIRNRNEAEFIGFAIQSCLDYFNKPEIIIVDNNSTDDSLEIVNLFKDRTTIKIISINDYTPGKSINLGVKKASNDYILILSAHAQINSLNFEKVKQHLKNNNVAVFGNQIPIYKGKKISKRYIWKHFVQEEILDMYSNMEQRYFLHNAFCFYEKNVLINNPMPEQYPGKEDRYWAKDMINKHHHYIYDPKISVNHFYTGNGATWKGIG